MTHYDLLLSAIIKSQNRTEILSSLDETIFKEVIKDWLEFFCPKEQMQIKPMYRELFADLFKKRSQQHFLYYLLEFLDIAQRWHFLEGIFTLHEIKQITEIQSFLDLLPKREDEVSVKAEESGFIFKPIDSLLLGNTFFSGK